MGRIQSDVGRIWKKSGKFPTRQSPRIRKTR